MTSRKVYWTDADVLCPFYVSDDRGKRLITCEGVIDDTISATKFKRLEVQQKHMGTYCVKHYTKCPAYQSVYNTKYRDGDE